MIRRGLLAFACFCITVLSQAQNQGGGNPYQELRQFALSKMPDEVGLDFPGDTLVVYGVVWDWPAEEFLVTTIAFITGDASIYFEDGGGIVGGGQHEKIAKEARNLIATAQKIFPETKRAVNTELPAGKMNRFYLLTNQGIFLAEDVESNLSRDESVFSGLFWRGQELIGQIRMMTEENKKN